MTLGHAEWGIVRILDARTGKPTPIGAGFLISDRHALTCAHVVNESLGLNPYASDKPDVPIFYDLPVGEGGDPAADTPDPPTARVIAWYPALEQPRQGLPDDIAVLALDTPCDPERALPLLRPESPVSAGYRGHAYGFPERGDSGVWAQGELTGHQHFGWRQIDDVKDPAIAAGFSGCPFLDTAQECAIGMVVARHYRFPVSYLIPVAVLLQAWKELARVARQVDLPQPGPVKTAVEDAASMKVETGGGAYIGRDLFTGGGGVAGRDQTKIMIDRVNIFPSTDVTRAAPSTATENDVPPPSPARRTLATPVSPSPDLYALTLELVCSDNALTVHYALAGPRIEPRKRPWPEARALLQAHRGAGVRSAPAPGGAAPGDALFALLFGDDEADRNPLFRAVFGYTEHDPRPNPTRGGVRLRICSRDPLFLSQPWAKLSWEGHRLTDHRWEIVTGSDVAPAGECITVPAGEFLVVAPAGAAGGEPGAAFAALVDELWPRLAGAPSAAARIVEEAAQLDAALQGMRPHGVYVRAALAAGADEPAVLLDGAGGPLPYPFFRLARALGAMDLPPRVLILDLADVPSPEIPVRLALELGDRVPLILWRRRASGREDGDRILLAGLRRWLGSSEDPVTALHTAMHESALSAPAAAATGFVIHANYRTWRTTTARLWPDPPPRLAVNRDSQKALVTRHLGELVRSRAVRVMAVLAYGSPENLLSELTRQLDYELELTAADLAAIAWQRLGLPDDRTDLRARLGAHMAEVLSAQREEPLRHLLWRKRPRGMRPGIPGVLWLDWGVLDGSEPAHLPTAGELEDWLSFCSEELGAQCPPELRLVCSLAIELPEDKYRGLADWFEDFRDEPWYLLDRFRFLALDPLGRVDTDHLRDYLAGIESGLDELSRAELVRLVRRKTAGAFDATVRLLEEGRDVSWIALLQRLRAGRNQGKRKRRSRTL